MKTNQYRRFDTIATHHLAHLDEFTGATLLYNFGESFFPGVRNARFEFLKREPEHAVPGTIYIGIGQERLGEFDEHRSIGPRLQNTCTTSLVARRLGVANKPGVHDLVGEVLWCDTRPKVFPTQLATLVKLAHRVRITSDQLGTFQWANDAINTLIFRFGEFDKDYDIRQAWQNFREDEKIPQIASVESLIEGTYGRRDSFVTELANIAGCMRPDLRQKWLPLTFRMLVQDSKMFAEAVEEVNTKAETAEFETEKGPHPMVLIVSDNEHIARAATSAKTGRAALTVIRSTKGLTAIMCNHEHGLDLSSFATMIRMAEYRKCTGKKLPIERAQGDGIVPPVSQWCFANNNLLLNGSLTHPLVMPSKLSLDEIKDIATRAFMRTQCEAWFLNYFEGSNEVGLPKDEAVKLVLS